jgi:hypothetical protein
MLDQQRVSGANVHESKSGLFKSFEPYLLIGLGACIFFSNLVNSRSDLDKSIINIQYIPLNIKRPKKSGEVFIYIVYIPPVHNFRSGCRWEDYCKAVNKSRKTDNRRASFLYHSSGPNVKFLLRYDS